MNVAIVIVLTLVAVQDAANVPSDFSVVENDGVRIESTVHAHLYTWKITNDSRFPIVRLELSQHATYNQQVPPGWNFTFENDYFVAQATDRQYAIHPGAVATFTARGSSEGAIIGLRPAVIGLDDSTSEIHFESIWSPIAKPRLLVWLVASVISGLALIHVWLIRRRPVRWPPVAPNS